MAGKSKPTTKFWSSRNSTHSSSDYWLKGSIFNNDESFFKEKTIQRESKYDHYQMSQYQRAIGNFVRILTGRSDISVRYKTSGDHNFTDGKTITISPRIKEKEFDYSVGLALHEASHIVYTDFSVLKSLNYNELDRTYPTSSQTEKVMFKTLWNLIEDFYIDAATYKTSPGYRGYYSALYQKVFGSPKIVKAFNSNEYSELTAENYMFHLINIRNPERNLDALPDLRKMFDMLDLKNILRLTKTEDRMDLAYQIFGMIREYIKKDALDQKNERDGSSNNPTQSELGDIGGSSTEIESSGNDDDSESNEDFSSGSEDLSDGDDSDASDVKPLSDRQIKEIEKLFKDQQDFINGILHKGNISKREQSIIDAFSSVDIEVKNVDLEGEFSTKPIPVKVIRNINRQFVNDAGSMFGFKSWYSSYREEKIQDAINKGKVLANKLQIRNEERVIKSTRLNSGKIDKRLLHEIGVDNYEVFSKINIESYKPAFIHISLDQSGSMSGSLWDSAIKFAALMASASKNLPNIHLVVSTRSTAGEGKDELPFIMTIFDSKINSIHDILYFFSRIGTCGTTPEGLAFNAIMKEIQTKSRNTDAYFINVCDGEPYYGYSNQSNIVSYQGEPARKHSKAQMRMMESSGIKFMTYFIGEYGYGSDASFRRVQECYGNNAVQLKSASDIFLVAKTMNKYLLQK